MIVIPSHEQDSIDFRIRQAKAKSLLTPQQIHDVQLAINILIHQKKMHPETEYAYDCDKGNVYVILWLPNPNDRRTSLHPPIKTHWKEIVSAVPEKLLRGKET